MKTVYGQFCPVAVASEIFAERWNPLILRELVLGSRRFNDIHRGVPRMSRTLLAQRLRELQAAGVIERLPKKGGRGYEYRLSRAGEALRPIIMQLGEWGNRWVYTRVAKEDLDPGLLMWDMHRRIRTEALPDRQIVVQFDYRGVSRRDKGMQRWWLVLARSGTELCLKDPGYEVDLLVTADLHAMTQVWTGEIAIKDALRQGAIVLHGPPALAKAFPGWLKLGVFAHAEPRGGIDAAASR